MSAHSDLALLQATETIISPSRAPHLSPSSLWGSPPILQPNLPHIPPAHCSDEEHISCTAALQRE